jgi:hypothetical protein
MSTLIKVASRPARRNPNDPMRLRRFSVEEYHQMIKSGILNPNKPVELLEGWIVEKMAQNPPHSSSVRRVHRRIARVLPADWTMSVQSPITLSASEPEPDISLARGQEEIYDSRHPQPSAIGILMEVGDATLLEDRRYKGALYAQEKIPEFWLINVVKRKIEVYTRPRAGKYQKKADYSATQMVPLVLDGVKIADIPVGELIATRPAK